MCLFSTSIYFNYFLLLAFAAIPFSPRAQYKFTIRGHIDSKDERSPQRLTSGDIMVLKFINLQRAAEAFMNQFPHWTMLQFDIISVTLTKGNEPAILFIEDIYY